MFDGKLVINIDEDYFISIGDNVWDEVIVYVNVPEEAGT